MCGIQPAYVQWKFHVLSPKSVCVWTSYVSHLYAWWCTKLCDATLLTVQLHAPVCDKHKTFFTVKTVNLFIPPHIKYLWMSEWVSHTSLHMVKGLQRLLCSLWGTRCGPKGIIFIIETLWILCEVRTHVEEIVEHKAYGKKRHNQLTHSNECK